MLVRRISLEIRLRNACLCIISLLKQPMNGGDSDKEPLSREELVQREHQVRLREGAELERLIEERCKEAAALQRRLEGLCAEVPVRRLFL
jgi:hypothetical protein